MKIYYDKDADLSLIKGKQVTIVGYGSQGHAHALNLHESGVKVTVGLRKGGPSWTKAEKAGLTVKEVAEAVKGADFVMMLMPDEHIAGTYRKDVEPNIRKGATLAFAHGFNIHFGQVIPRADLDVVMIAPKGPGHLVRRQYTQGIGVPGLVAVHQDATGNALQLALAYGMGVGCARGGLIETSFGEETETDLFGEQAVLCGGTTRLVQLGFETLVEAGYQPEIAYFECLHELKLIVDLMYEGGMARMRHSISDTAEYGDLTVGPKIVDEHVRENMRKQLVEIQEGRFARELFAEEAAGRPHFEELRKRAADHQIEEVGARLREMMPWTREGASAAEATHSA